MNASPIWIGESLPGEPVSDDELTMLALSGDPDCPLARDARPIEFHSSRVTHALPRWYMPEVAVTRFSGWRLPVALGIVVVLVALEALGLCSVFGQVVIG